MQELKALHDQLVHYEPPEDEDDEDEMERPPWMDETCPVLMTKRILNHQHKDVRLLACCCVVEMLRVYAPEAPFSDEQLADAFEAIIIELRGLQHPERAAFERVSSILESLARVKSCVIVVGMAEQGNEELVTSMFEVLLQSARPEHTSETRALMADVMKTCIEEFEGPVPDSLVEVLLEAVLHFRASSDEGEDDDALETIADPTQRAKGACVMRARKTQAWWVWWFLCAIVLAWVLIGCSRCLAGLLAADVCRCPEAEKPLQMFLNRLALGYGLMHNTDAEDDHAMQVRPFDVRVPLVDWLNGRSSVVLTPLHGNSFNERATCC